MNDIIAAISTPLGKGAISIVRMSGQGCKELAARFFSAKNLNFENLQPRYLYLGGLQIEKGVTEKCFMVYFKAPQSFTGEDMIEFQVHGGVLLTQKVLRLLIENGARLAENGEFSRRAFENGKISLDEAESIIDEINADSESELRASLCLADGRLKNEVVALQNGLTDCLAQIEAALDYPEEDIEESAKDDLFRQIDACNEKVGKFLSDAKNAGYIKNGINVAIVGSPNVGKSSLLNGLVGADRAIVTDIAGTTRDVLNESLTYRGVKLNFIDTAGIRDSADKVEQIGIEKSKAMLEGADVVLWVIDSSREMNEYDRDLQKLLSGRDNVILVKNKYDIAGKNQSAADGGICVSALQNQNLDAVKEAIFQKVISEEIDYSRALLTNERQIETLKNCQEIINQIYQSRDEGMDVIAMQIKRLWNELGKITGECENEQIIDLIFSKFCLGK